MGVLDESAVGTETVTFGGDAPGVRQSVNGMTQPLLVAGRDGTAHDGTGQVHAIRACRDHGLNGVGSGLDRRRLLEPGVGDEVVDAGCRCGHDLGRQDVVQDAHDIGDSS